MQEKKELNWVNVAKAISIITVLFVHTENYYGLKLGEINQFLCGFYVNAFFLISGYLLFRKQLNKPAIEAGSAQYIIGDGKKLIFSILYRLYIPMIIFSSIEFLPKIMITHRAFEFNALLIETQFGDEVMIEGYFILLPELDSYDKILSALGIAI